MTMIRVAGVDEVGRGPLAGPVVAAAVVFEGNCVIEGLRDSKKLSHRQREQYDFEVRNTALAVGVGCASAEEVDRINVLQATMLAMQRAVKDLEIEPQHILVDGNRCPEVGISCQAIVGGDSRVPVISAASIVAKVYRDSLMRKYDLQFPEYGFARHKGYPTRAHVVALQRFGPCAIHRKSFAPVRELTIPSQ